ncbi:MAG: acetylxylan esterase [Verrucomicrobiae bacterium]|nr:acetylxylan esterase [Verrucomicrobiae bacterium]
MKISTAARRRQLYRLLGDLPPRHRPIRVVSRHIEHHRDYVLERLRLDLNGEEIVPALFAKPHGPTRRWPTVLYNHSHGGLYNVGKDELFNPKPYLIRPGYGPELLARGYAVLAIDHWVFGERATRPEFDVFKEMLWHGRAMWGAMVYDSLRALDYLVTRPDVDPRRLATIGMSMGSAMAQWVAALDPRIKVCVDICCLTDYHALIKSNGLARHSFYYYVPGLLKKFTAAQINALIAPRPHLSLAGTRDPLTPLPGLKRIDRELRQVYRAAGAPNAWRLLTYPVEHQETPAMRKEALAWLERWL